MAQLQSTCVIGTLAISSSHSNAQQAIMIGGGSNNAEFNNQCNLIAIGENTALSGSGALNPDSLNIIQEGCNFCICYAGYYARSQPGYTGKPITYTGGGGGSGAVLEAFIPFYGFYSPYSTINRGDVTGINFCDLGSGYTSTLTGTVSDPTTAGETCEIFTVDPFKNNDSINIGHNAGCRAQGNNTVRIGTCAGRGNLTNGYCYQIDSIAIGKNTMVSGSFENSVVIGHNSFTGNNTCTNYFRCQFFNTIIGNNNFPSSSQKVSYNTLIGYNNLPSVSCSACNTVIGTCNVQTTGTAKQLYTDNTIIGTFNMSCSGRGSNNVIIGCRNMAFGCLNSANCNIAIGVYGLYYTTTGDRNVALGYFAGYNNTTGTSNVYMGPYSGRGNSTGGRSVYIGCSAGCGMGNQNDSIFIGPQTGRYGGSDQGGHVVVGIESLRNMASGYFNIAIGYCTLAVGGQYASSCALSGTGYNIAIGPYAGRYNKTSSQKNIYIGHAMGPSSLTTESCKFCLGMDSGNALLVGCLLSSGKTLGVCGTLSKTAGSFQISHPDPVKTETKDLWHSFVESPTAGDNLYRFEVEVENGQAIIDLPDYYKHLNENDQVWVNAKNHFGRAYGVVNQEQTTLTVFADTDGEYNVLLIGTRKDKDAVKAWKGIERLKEN